MSLVPACEAFAFLEEFEERSGIITIYLDLLVALKFCAVCKFAELMDAFISTGSLLTKLIAWEVEYLEALLVVCLIELFQFLILRSKATLGSCVNDEQYFVSVLFEGNFLSLSVLNGEFVNGSHFNLYLILCLFLSLFLRLWRSSFIAESLSLCKGTIFLLEIVNSLHKFSKKIA